MKSLLYVFTCVHFRLFMSSLFLNKSLVEHGCHLRMAIQNKYHYNTFETAKFGKCGKTSTKTGGHWGLKTFAVRAR